jgi:GNAT superfamily N-acetyltransferase
VASLTIRPATPADIQTLRTLAGAIWREYYPSILSAGQIDYMLTQMYEPEVIRQEMASDVIWQLAIHADEPVGYLSFDHDKRAETITLRKLYLQPRLHGRGIGRQLIDHVKAAATTAGARTISLRVNRSNARAIRAYEQAGFSISGSLVSDIGGGFVMDDYVMTFEIQPTAGRAAGD